MQNNSVEEKALSLPIQLSELAKVLTFSTVSILSFFVPFTLGHPQWLVGTIINACLFLTAMYLPKRYFIPLAILPSLGVLARGIIFGPMTMFLVYFAPFIWLGNLLLIFLFLFLAKEADKLINYKGLSFVLSAILASVGKFALIFIVANIYFKLHYVPAMFLQTMGLFQLYTALAGGVISFIIYKSIKKWKIIFRQSKKNY